MRRCKHSALVEVSNTAQLCLVDPHRVQYLVETLPCPAQQQPLLVACVGNEEKTLALQQLFPANDRKERDRRNGLCKVYTDVLSTHSAHPILFMDIDPRFEPPTQETNTYCHETKAYRLQADVQRQPLNATVLERLVLPFVDVVCIFAQDLGGLAEVLKLLQTWTSLDATATEDQLCFARLVIITTENESSPAVLEETEFLEGARAAGLYERFASLTLQLVSSRPLRSARYHLLRDALLQSEVAAARDHRQKQCRLFSALHTASLFSASLAHMARYPDRPFDIIGASRQGIPAPPHLVNCLSAFLRAVTRYSVPQRLTASLLATAFLVQAYPQAAHGKSPPTYR